MKIWIQKSNCSICSKQKEQLVNTMPSDTNSSSDHDIFFFADRKRDRDTNRRRHLCYCFPLFSTGDVYLSLKQIDLFFKLTKLNDLFVQHGHDELFEPDQEASLRGDHTMLLLQIRNCLSKLEIIF
ncbi:hypothetical protein TKK_0015949 [Trichogramma kaykai]